MEIIFNLFKIRFKLLDELLTKQCKELTPNSTINMFINFEPILKKLVSANIEEYLKVKKEERAIELMSNILNLTSHYRSFFSKNKLYSKIYIYFSYPILKNTYKNRMINVNYRKYYEDKYANNPKTFVLFQTLSTIIPLLSVITEYIEGVYLIKSNNIESSLVPYVLTNGYKDNSLNLILSNDKYEYQYVNNNFYILNPKKQDSYIVSKENVIETIKFEDKIVNNIDIDSNLYPFIKSILGDKYRNIEKIKNLGLLTIIKTLDKAIKKGIINNNTNSINILSNIIKEEFRNQLLINYYTTSLDIQFKALTIKDIYTITEQVIDRFDNLSLKNLNDKYFTQYPIQLLELTSSITLSKKKI